MENWRIQKVMYHELGTDVKTDKVIIYEPNHLYRTYCYKSSSKEYLLLVNSGHEDNEVYYLDMKDESLTPKLLVKRKEKVKNMVDHGGKYFYMHTNDEATKFKLLRTSAEDCPRVRLSTKGETLTSEVSADEEAALKAIWKDYIPEEQDKYLSGFDITKDYLLLKYSVKGLAESIVKRFSDEVQQVIVFPDAAYEAELYSTNYEENDLRLTYESPARPLTIYQYDFDADKLETLKVQEIPSGFNAEEYNVERLYVKTDGVEVPISLVYKKSLFKKDGSNPVYLYGYGSYGNAIHPSFRSSIFSLVNRGFVYAVGHIRGGDDLGYEWYESAKFLTKKRTFNDFIACAEHLIEEKYTSEKNIIIAGGSAGGMLIGNVINQRPELFKAAIAHVPFVDVLNTMLDETLPLTPGEFKEWGNPKEKDYFDYILSYSPYENVKTQNYPHLFVTAGLSDPRVGYWEPAKWVARLRDTKTDDSLLFMKTNMDYGHGGASGRFDYLKDIAEEFVFITDIFKIDSKL